MSRQRVSAWPPLITLAEKPRWFWWRDFALTVAMWLLFAIMLETEFELFFGRHLERMGWGDLDTNANWPRFFERLQSYLYIIIILTAFLAIAAVATVERYFRYRRRPPPIPLPAADQAHGTGMSEADLLAARQLPNVVVHIGSDGTHRLERRKR